MRRFEEELMNRGSKYWDEFELRTIETVNAMKNGSLPPLRRLSVHLTRKCNMACKYCNDPHNSGTLV